MPNPVAPGSSGHNRLRAPGIAGVILGNFDRKAETEETLEESNKRLLRPGAILLANLDIDHPIDGSRKRYEQLDAMDHEVSDGDDSREMATLKIRKPDPCNRTASRVVLHVHPDDAKRIRVFTHGVSNTVFLGEGKIAHAHETLTAAREFEYELPPTKSPWEFHFQVEAVTLVGSPRAPEPRQADDLASPPSPAVVPAAPTTDPLPASPTPPTPYEVFMPADPTTPVTPAPTGDPIYEHRLPGEVWFELVHLDHAGNLLPDARQIHDVALYTIAPWMMLSNLQRAEILYISNLPDNADTVGDVERAIARISGVRLRKISEAECGGDQWVQDELEIGYCWAVHNWMHVVLHCKRTGYGLKKFVREHLPEDNIGLFDDITEDLSALPHDPGEPPPTEAVNFGGNLEVSPPVPGPTALLPDGKAGPEVPAHKAAPFGKILLGHHPTRRPVDKYHLNFLEAQRVQPILFLDTSWLEVGHVDEFMCVVPANSGKKFKLVLASPTTAAWLLDEAKSLHDSDPVAHPLTKLHRGKSWTNRPGDDAVSVDAVLTSKRDFNDEVELERLFPIEDRLVDGLGLDAAEDIIYLPVFFKNLPLGSVGTGGRTSAYTPDLANLQVVNDHVLINRPFSARMKRADVGTILRDSIGMPSATDSRLRPYEQHIYWALAGEPVADIAGYFVDGGVTESDIRNANPGKFDASGEVKDDWTRLLIPERTVDLFEAYAQIQLEDIGLTVHWIDDWYTYHILDGEIHCGTNVKRRPPELDAADDFTYWWDVYAELVK